MDFIECSLKGPFVINKYGIPEPRNGKIVYSDILLVPLVAFDKNLNRLGYGGGYYDRLIQFLKKKKKVIIIGLAYDFQEYHTIPVSKYDQKLDCIVTIKNFAMKILFLGDIVGESGCLAIKNYLSKKIKENKLILLLLMEKMLQMKGLVLQKRYQIICLIVV